jgi:hypothetical protein
MAVSNLLMYLVLLANVAEWTTQALTALRPIDIVSYPDGPEAKLRGRPGSGQGWSV